MAKSHSIIQNNAYSSQFAVVGNRRDGLDEVNQKNFAKKQAINMVT